MMISAAKLENKIKLRHRVKHYSDSHSIAIDHRRSSCWYLNPRCRESVLSQIKLVYAELCITDWNSQSNSTACIMAASSPNWDELRREVSI